MFQPNFVLSMFCLTTPLFVQILKFWQIEEGKTLPLIPWYYNAYIFYKAKQYLFNIYIIYYCTQLLRVVTGLFQNGCHENVILVIQYQEALTEAYSTHDLRLVGISNKSEFSTAKMAQCTMYPVLTWSKFRPDMIRPLW